METMCAKSFLYTKANYSTNIKQPQPFKMSGYYPLTYIINFDSAAQTYSISIDNLKSH